MTNNIRNTMIAMILVAIIALVGIFSVGFFEFNGETLKWIVALTIVAVAGLGGYELREQLKQQ